MGGKVGSSGVDLTENSQNWGGKSCSQKSPEAIGRPPKSLNPCICAAIANEVMAVTKPFCCLVVATCSNPGQHDTKDKHATHRPIRAAPAIFSTDTLSRRARLSLPAQSPWLESCVQCIEHGPHFGFSLMTWNFNKVSRRIREKEASCGFEPRHSSLAGWQRSSTIAAWSSSVSSVPSSLFACHSGSVQWGIGRSSRLDAACTRIVDAFTARDGQRMTSCGTCCR